MKSKLAMIFDPIRLARGGSDLRSGDAIRVLALGALLAIGGGGARAEAASPPADRVELDEPIGDPPGRTNPSREAGGPEADAARPGDERGETSETVEFRRRPSPRSFREGERRVGILWSLDYRYPDVGFTDPAAPYGDPLRYHFREPRLVNPLDVDWLGRRIAAIAETGVDWVAIRQTFDVDEERASALPHLVSALDRGRPNDAASTPRVAAYIAIDAEHEARGILRLSSPWGKDALYESVASFYRDVPPRHRAMIEDRPIVVLAEPPESASYGEDLFEVLRRRFRAEFGAEPFLVVERRWGLAADATFAAGGALAGPALDCEVALIGPGFDDSRDPRGAHPVRDREEGAFYRNAWNAVRAGTGSLVLIDSWNDLRRGTAICATREFGARYLEITRDEIARFRAGAAAEEPVELRYPHPRPRPDWSWGRDARDASKIVYDPAGPLVDGLAIVQPPDGAVRIVDAAGRPCLMTIGTSAHVSRYAYFAVSDYFCFDAECDFVVEIEYYDGGAGAIELQFDGCDTVSIHEGAYRGTRPIWRSGTARWERAIVRLPRARFANRQNGGADFRIAARGVDAILGRVTVRKAEGF